MTMLAYGITCIDGKRRAVTCEGFGSVRRLIDAGSTIKFRPFYRIEDARAYVSDAMRESLREAERRELEERRRVVLKARELELAEKRKGLRK